MASTVKSFSSISANNLAFEQNMDILQNIIDNSPDKYAVRAAKEIKNTLMGSYAEAINAIIADIAENAIPEIAEAIMTKNPYTLAFLIAMKSIAFITGIQEDLKQHFQMFAYTELVRATIRLFNNKTYVGKNYCESLKSGNGVDEMLKRYLTHIAQLRILGETKFCEWKAYEGVIGWFKDNKKIEDKVEIVIDNIINHSKKLQLNLNKTLIAK